MLQISTESFRMLKAETIKITKIYIVVLLANVTLSVCWCWHSSTDTAFVGYTMFLFIWFN